MLSISMFQAIFVFWFPKLVNPSLLNVSKVFLDNIFTLLLLHLTNPQKDFIYWIVCFVVRLIQCKEAQFLCLSYFAFAKVSSLPVFVVYGLSLYRHAFYRWGDSGRSKSLRRHAGYPCSMKFSKIAWVVGSDPGHHQLVPAILISSLFPLPRATTSC